MKSNILVKSIVLTVLVVFSFACNSPAKKTEKPAEKNTVSRVEVSINGMSCGGCEQKVQEGVAKLEGIKSVKAFSAMGKAFVDFSPALTDTAKIRTAITEAGYSVTGFEIIKAEEPAK